jgi:hypothetical protein
MDWEDSIDSWFEAVRDRLLAEGQKDPAAIEVVGYKLVEGKSNRVWGENEEAVKTAFGALLGEKIYEPKKVLSPAKMEKLVSKEDVARFTVKPAGKPTLVKLSDKRQAIPAQTGAAEVFDVIGQEQKQIWP